MSPAYYNDNDMKAALWLGELMAQGLITHGAIECKSIAEVTPNDVAGNSRVHLFAGIGGWDLALQLAGWPEGIPVWTGSCPCQPFSSAGKRLGTADKRHLWPEMLRLISECRPPAVFGEQVASPLGREWLSGVRADLEALGYAVGAADLCAAGVNAPHIRQRLYWVGDTYQWRRKLFRQQNQPEMQPGAIAHGSSTFFPCRGPFSKASPWDHCQIIHFRDGKTRRIKSGIEPVAYGIPGRVGLLRGYGNAIVPQVAAAFISAAIQCFQLEEDVFTLCDRYGACE